MNLRGREIELPEQVIIGEGPKPSVASAFKAIGILALAWVLFRK